MWFTTITILAWQAVHTVDTKGIPPLPPGTAAESSNHVSKNNLDTISC